MLKCIRCKERKDQRKFCSPRLFIHYCAKFNIPLPPPTKHTLSQPIALCGKCLRYFAIRDNKRKHLKRPKYRLSQNIRTGISKSLKTGKSGLWEQLVGYTTTELKEYLQRRFKPGMSWENYGQWHIDHIRPISTFDFTKYQDNAFKQCWALSNLRPLWARDNWTRKKNRQPMRKCFDESPYVSCLDCPQIVHIKYRGRFCQRFHRKVPQWWETQQ